MINIPPYIPSYTTSYLCSVAYYDNRNGLASLRETRSYNLRSWLTNIDGQMFTEVLKYENSTTPQWGGNISVMQWGESAVQNAYSFMYDTHSRLMTANYSNSSSVGMFSEIYNYDSNGNMLRHIRETNPLTMSYSGNRLASAGNAAFEYDAKGRQVMSAYGSGLSTVYNLLDLPQRHTTGEGTVVDYKYAFDGRKLQEKVTAGTSVTQRDYSGEFLYEEGVLKKILFDGGYVMNGESGPVYMFFLRDHLGSVRAVVSETGAVQQMNHYFPYGDLFPTSAADSTGNRYKYTGKESGDETDLYDFSARFLHTRFGRFTTIDPLAEKYPDISPYAYCNGNPVNFVDPDGKYFEGVNDKRALRMQRKLERRAQKLSKQAERLERRNKDAEDLIERAMELRKSAQDIRDMRGDVDTEYRFIRSKTPETYAKMESKTEVVYMHFRDFETKIHEARHGGQHARGEINALNFQGYGVMDEVDSYRAQYSWRGVYHYFYDDTSEWAVMNRIYRGLNPLVGTINNIRDITHAFVNHLYEDGTYLYPPQNMNVDYWNTH